jgi:hypothetical protein
MFIAKTHTPPVEKPSEFGIKIVLANIRCPIL